jgi:uncharacterized protein YndB with AHSA1/START domain
MTTQQQEAVLRLSRTFSAPRERVFDAWTDPDVLREWWSAMPTMTPTIAEVDLREGGRYRLGMRDSESGHEHVVVGEYREIRRPERLAYTWIWEGSPEMTGGETLVEIEFNEDGDGTEVVLTHTGLPTEDSRGRHAHGWNGCFDSLARYLG